MGNIGTPFKRAVLLPRHTCFPHNSCVPVGRLRVHPRKVEKGEGLEPDVSGEWQAAIVTGLARCTDQGDAVNRKHIRISGLDGKLERGLCRRTDSSKLFLLGSGPIVMEQLRHGCLAPPGSS